MNLLDLAEEINLSPQKAASTHGGEFKSACPKCQEGKDRFCIWPNQGKSGRYWCRVCDTKGDGIQFCRDFLGMTFQQACQKINIIPKFQERSSSYNSFQTTKFTPQPIKSINYKWQQSANIFVETSHNRLMCTSEALNHLIERGFSLNTISHFYLGWNPDNLFEKRNKWGMLQVIKENGCPKRQWLPKGIVIPSYANNSLNKLKIRRTDWHEKDNWPKYIEVSGSKQSLSIYGDISKPIIIVESELDAMLVQQYASHLVCSLALGGVSKKPDHEIHSWLKQSPLILLSLDFDDPSKKKYIFWMKNYPNLKPWPSPKSKSIGDAVKIFQTDVLSWVESGLALI
jgi:DNA primase